jgi:hypothetical protein
MDIRREAERGLALHETGDEKRGARFPLMVTAAVCFILAALAFCLRAARRVFHGGIFTAVPVLLIAVGLGCLYPLVKPLLARDSAGTGVPSRSSGVTKETEVRRIPDAAGAVILSFNEGQPVRIIERSGKNASDIWYHVIAHNDTGEAGWVREGRIVFY